MLGYSDLRTMVIDGEDILNGKILISYIFLLLLKTYPCVNMENISLPAGSSSISSAIFRSNLPDVSTPDHPHQVYYIFLRIEGELVFNPAIKIIFFK
jgi:hypothetical protein